MSSEVICQNHQVIVSNSFEFPQIDDTHDAAQIAAFSLCLRYCPHACALMIDGLRQEYLRQHTATTMKIIKDDTAF